MKLVPLFAFALALSVLGPLSCTRSSHSSNNERKGTLSPLHPSKPLSAITNAAPFRAVVIAKLIRRWETEDATTAVVELQMPDKTIFSVGQTKATPIEIEFLNTLEVGQQYSFPEVF